MIKKINPSRYCARVGQTGGDICTNETYYNQPDFLAGAHKYQ